MSRPSAALQQWLHFRQSLSHTSLMLNLRTSNPLAPATRLALTTARNGINNSRRPFHTTQYRPSKARRESARPAPALRRKKEDSEAGKDAIRATEDGFGLLNTKGFYMDPLSVKIDKLVPHFLLVSRSIYDEASRDGLLPGISFRTFEDTAIKLFKSVRGTPNPHIIRSISTDVDAVFRIGFPASSSYGAVREWIISACALAGARQPIVLSLARSITWTKTTVRTKWTDLVEQFSDEGFPPAMVLHAKILAMRGEYEKAFELMEKRVLPFLSPTRRKPSLFNDITMGDLFESPWRVYALLHASYDAHFDSPESRQKSDDATRIAALEYNDPQALIEYASLKMNEKDYEKYEECMCQAATTCEPNAILYLANYYYHTFHGRYPTAGERAALAKAKAQGQPAPTIPTPSSTSETKANPTIFTTALNWVSSFFNQSMPREDYRKLAMDWYALGFHSGIPQAAFMLALMAREQGDELDGSVFMDRASEDLEKDPEFAKKIQELRDNWYDPEYVPRLSSKMLAVR
ncbi:hypothetical protein PMG11_00911 [Penicillium brasilianum]|uniref:Uncharacterized protein n=1 Tax=Penicillium brasilianum TaxID=104259 RepID=A0A0F7TFC8_PENBI|nr:hypothetical protein PMG11_00911 [Penicillium brasilianum]